MFKEKLLEMSVRSNVWSFTVNTRGRVNKAFLDKLIKYLNKCPGGYICREKPETDKEHIHGLVMYENIRHKDSVSKQFSRMMEIIPAEEYVFKQALKLNPVYNDDWKTNYLQKAEDTICDYDNVINVTYCTQITKRENGERAPLSQLVLSVCQTEEIKDYKSIRVAIFKYLRDNGLPPPRMDQITSMTKSLYCYMNIDNEDLINKLPVPEGYEREINPKTLRELKFSIY